MSPYTWMSTVAPIIPRPVPQRILTEVHFHILKTSRSNRQVTISAWVSSSRESRKQPHCLEATENDL